MSKLILTLVREYVNTDNTVGSLYANGEFIGYTLEDAMRVVKIPKETAIPCGFYKVSLSQSPRFGRLMPLIHDVSGFSGVRIHGGNDEDDTEGCPLLGSERSKTRVWNCAKVNRDLIDLIESASSCFLSVVYYADKRS